MFTVLALEKDSLETSIGFVSAVETTSYRSQPVMDDPTFFNCNLSKSAKHNRRHHYGSSLSRLLINTVLACIHSMQTHILLPFALQDSIETHFTTFYGPFFLSIHIHLPRFVASEFVSHTFSI